MFNLCLPHDVGQRFWSSLDKDLSNLVDHLRTLGYKRALELEFRHNHNFDGKVSDAGPGTFLPKFWEKGRVTFSEATSGQATLLF